EDLVGLDRRRPVRTFDDDRRVDAVGVRARELVFAGGEDQDLARKLEKLFVRDPVAAVVTGERSVLCDVGMEGRDIEAGLVVGPARDVRDRDDAGAALVQFRGRDTAYVPESLDD